MIYVLLIIALYMSLRFVGECRLALAGVQVPARPTPRGRQLVFESGVFSVKLEYKVA